MSGSMLTALAAGALSGLMFGAINVAGAGAVPLFTVALVPALAFVPLPAFAVGLSKGQEAALYALGAATVVTAALGGLDLALKYVLLFAVPQAWLTRQALLSRTTPAGVEWYSPGLLVAWITAFAASFVTAVTIAFSGTEGGLVGTIQMGIEPALRSMAGVHGVELSETDLRAMASMMPAAMANLWMLMMVVNGALAQSLVARGGRNLRPSSAFADFEVPAVLMYALGAALVLSFLSGTPGFLGRTLVALITLPYFILGLAVIHRAARGMAARRPLLIATYFLIIVMQWLVGVVIVLGLAEHAFGLRERFFGTKKS